MMNKYCGKMVLQCLDVPSYKCGERSLISTKMKHYCGRSLVQKQGQHEYP